MACDVKSILNDAKCFFCLSPHEMEALKAALLCDILADVEGLIAYLESLPGE